MSIRIDAARFRKPARRPPPFSLFPPVQFLPFRPTALHRCGFAWFTTMQRSHPRGDCMTLEESNPSGVAIPAAHQHGPSHHFGPAAVGLSLLTAALWGGTAVGSRFALDALPPIAVGGIRFTLAAVFMIGWCRWERSPLTL